MIEPAFHFCPQCGKELHIKEENETSHQECKNGHVLYKNQNLAVAGILIHEGKMLMVRRAREPQKGWFDLPGGFVDADEKPSDAMKREIKEELGVECEVLQLFGLYGPDPYPYKNVTYYNAAATYLVRCEKTDFHPQDDVASIEWVDLDNLPYGKMAFPSQNEFLEDVRSGKISLQ
jgi:NAD+ diphosphatase